jgi:putative endonuclease
LGSKPEQAGEGEFWVYVLRSQKTGRFYTGSCSDLRHRFEEHNRGESKATRHGVPWVLMLCEQFASRSEAARRELFLKTGAGRDEVKRLLESSQVG